RRRNERNAESGRNITDCRCQMRYLLGHFRSKPRRMTGRDCRGVKCEPGARTQDDEWFVGQCLERKRTVTVGLASRQWMPTRYRGDQLFIHQPVEKQTCVIRRRRPDESRVDLFSGDQLDERIALRLLE